MAYTKVNVEELAMNPFVKIGKEWMLVTAQKADGSVNSMTASWGTMGVFWNKNIVTIGLRPQRYTREFIADSGIFTLTFFDGERQDEMMYLGRTSGRDEDKMAKCGLNLVKLEDGSPAFAEGKLVLVCKVLMETKLDPNDFTQEWIDEKNYPAKDYHHMFTAEIIAAYQQ